MNRIDELVALVLPVIDRSLVPACTCAPGYFYKEKCHAPACARRIANQSEANRNAMANFNQGGR